MDVKDKLQQCYGSISIETVNVTLLGGLFFLLFFSYNTTQNFQSSINGDLGFYSLSVLYFFFSVTNLFSAIIVFKLGEKASLVLGAFLYTAYVAAQMYPVAWLLLPLAASLGFGASILWTAQGSLITKYSTPDSLGRNNGIFFSVFCFNMIFGNLFAALFLSAGLDTFYLFLVLTIVSTVASCLFVLLRKPPQRMAAEVSKDLNKDIEEDLLDTTEAEKPTVPVPLKRVSIWETIGLFKEKTMLLLVLISIYSGLSQSLNYGSFTLVIGDEILIGYVMALYGVFDSLGSIVNGKLSDKVGKRVIICAATCSAVIAYVISTIASIHGNAQAHPWLLYVSACFLGYADSGFNTQLYSMYGGYYGSQSEAAFAAFKLLQATSTAVAFFYSPFLTYPFIVLITAFFLAVGLECLVFLDIYVNPIDKPIPAELLRAKKEESLLIDTSEEEE